VPHSSGERRRLKPDLAQDTDDDLSRLILEAAVVVTAATDPDHRHGRRERVEAGASFCVNVLKGMGMLSRSRTVEIAL
jgi:hypothetical protein